MYSRVLVHTRHTRRHSSGIVAVALCLQRHPPTSSSSRHLAAAVRPPRHTLIKTTSVRTRRYKENSRRRTHICPSTFFPSIPISCFSTWRSHIHDIEIAKTRLLQVHQHDILQPREMRAGVGYGSHLCDLVASSFAHPSHSLHNLPHHPSLDHHLRCSPRHLLHGRCHPSPMSADVPTSPTTLEDPLYETRTLSMGLGFM
ncbi:hypothetical protein SISSUDRAFT_1068090 [Sistotremastrum suecicum HHB10207 ss-3]|uniref:Uncharacterized protein n=1 Tax=Sistotremastrum suecicum HHB10207 ss-3 TaxID=1314776 RepID=A0A165WFY5_9AGAM|nr:hypothetical protein SISSUDRAFT_1068090 [Sistotremastrum suecicum HHB10207 ss-3]